MGGEGMNAEGEGGIDSFGYGVGRWRCVGGC